jgi:hypothetical protein
VIAFHGYLLADQPPEDEALWFNSVAQAAQAAGFGAEPIWNTEDQPQKIYDPDQRIAWMARSYITQMALGLAKYCWFAWNSNDMNVEIGDGGLFVNDDLFDGGTGLSSLGVAYEQLYDWTVGNTFTAPCGPIVPDAGPWRCPLAGPNGYLAELVWDTADGCDAGSCGTTPFTNLPVKAVQYRDLAGNIVPITDAGVPIGAKPILIENQ